MQLQGHGGRTAGRFVRNRSPERALTHEHGCIFGGHGGHGEGVICSFVASIAGLKGQGVKGLGKKGTGGFKGAQLSIYRLSPPADQPTSCL